MELVAYLLQYPSALPVAFQDADGDYYELETAGAMGTAFPCLRKGDVIE